MTTPTIFTQPFCLRLLVLVFIAFFSPDLRAQLCTGSLGDPVVNITFGSGSGPSSYVPSNSYTYFPLPCPDDGYYTVTGQTSGCFLNSWHTVSSDHTGGGGSFMLVNASYSPGDFFITTVTDLCPNTTYEFAAWIMNVMIEPVSIKPDITFSIETPAGQVLNSFNTGDINVTTAPQWKQYGFFFKTPPNNAVIVLRMTNKAPGGNGNDVALDDITFRPCGSKISASIQGNNTDTIDVCTGDTNVYQFNAKVPAATYQQPVYQWQVSRDKGISWKDIAGANTLSYTRQPTGHGSYWYRLAVVEASFAGLLSCRIASNPLMINIHPSPLTDAGPDRTMLKGNSITLNGIVEGEQVTHVWSPGTYMNDINELKPEVSPITNMVYTLHAQSVYGCTNEDEVSVKVVEGLYVPNAFTPNGDGKNDTWQIPFLDPSFGGEVSIFNRWGQLVYHASATKVSWDGKFNGTLQGAGVYVYVITFKQGTMKDMKGTLTLLR